jgi:hypothetical protein
VTDLTEDALYDLLPALYRLRDVEQGYPLQALLRVITEQVDEVKRNIDRLWDDLTIETCQPWVIPYIGDLVGNNLLYDAGARSRVDVARTIFYRRRKGTLAMLERLAGDVTGWGAHAVEFFELLGWTQHVNHHRPASVRSPDLRDPDRLDRLDGPFDEIAHTADLRPPSTVEGWHAIANVGFFLYRLRSYPMASAPARRAGQGGYHFSSLGLPTPLFNRPAADAAGELALPGPVRPTGLQADLDRYRCELAQAGPDGPRPVSAYLSGKEPTLAISVEEGATTKAIEPERILASDLTKWAPPPAGMVAVDPRLGRLAFATGEEPVGRVLVTYQYGFSDDTGGGPYDRRRPPPSGPPERPPAGPDTVANPTALGTLIGVPSMAPSIQAAVNLWQATSGRPPTVIQIEDNRVYAEDLVIRMAGDRLTIQAENRRRPTLIGRVTIAGDNPDARLDLDGLLIWGWVHLTGDLKELRLRHCTLVPGHAFHNEANPAPGGLPSLIAEPEPCNRSLRLFLERSITGPLRLPEEMPGLVVADSILDGGPTAAIARTGAPDRSGPPAELRRSTVLGAVRVRELSLASEVVFTGAVTADRAQQGCVRFSFLAPPPHSRAPRRFRCQPDLALAARAKELGRELTAAEQAGVLARVRPAFTATRYGHPGYGQLSLSCPTEIKAGAEDDSEMGAFSGLRQPQRETNLRVRLDEYLPFGLRPALIYVT